MDLVMAVHGLGVRPALEYLAGFAGQVAGDPTPPRSVQARAPDPRALVALHRYVRECAHRLWRPSGATVREWLIQVRRLPADVLRANVVGADPGPGLQPRPAGVPRRAGAVFPVLDRGRVVYAQLRRLRATGDQPRYLSVGNRLAPRPAVAFYRAACPRDDTVVVTEGPVDALAAAAAGFDAAALLGTGGAGTSAAQALACLARPVVLALDADGAGRAATARLAAELTRLRSPSRVMGVPAEAGDVAGWLAAVDDWHAVFGEAVAVARPTRSAVELVR